MRTHVYQQEITETVQLLRKEAEGHTYFGVAFVLKSADALHFTEDDDDRSKVVFWTSATADGVTPNDLANVLRAAADALTAEAATPPDSGRGYTETIGGVTIEWPDTDTRD